MVVQRHNPFVGALHFHIRPSTTLGACNCHAHALAMAIVLALALYRPLLLTILPAIALSYWYYRRHLRLQSARSVCQLHWLEDRTWVWQLNNGSHVDGELLHATVLGCRLVLLQLRASGRKVGVTTVLLAADSLSPDMHRHLRARLTLRRWATGTSGIAVVVRDGLASLRAFGWRRN